MSPTHAVDLTPDMSKSGRGNMAGVITRTLVRSPVIRFILHARIRHSSCNDVVFVGDDFIHVKQVKGPGTLQHIATKDDFDGRIRAAKTFSNRKEAPDEDLFIKTEHGDTSPSSRSVPPQCLVLTLDSNDMLFLWLAVRNDGSLRFVQQACPMPTFDRIMFQPGEHLAVDPQSRAVAVAANEREVVIYSAKSKEKIQHELMNEDPDWCLVSAQRPLRIQGVIQQMDFLIPPSNDQGADDEDHIILLLVVTDQRKTRAVWIDWYASSDLHHAQIHAGHPLDVARSVPSLLVPLRNAAFLLIHGTEITRWKDILSGSPSSSVLDHFATEPSHPGASPRQPVWANWCRPKRGQAARRDTDHIYLVREDGNLYLVQIGPDKADMSHAGSFNCLVGTACASLGDSREPDILAVAGDMSNGSVQSIGSWFTPLDVPEMSRRSWAEMEWLETIPNWASVTDMVVSSLPGKSQRSRDGIFVTSGRQPYGTVTELRHGIEAALSAYFELEGLKSVTEVWALPFAAVGHILVILSSPTGTRLLDVSPDAAMENTQEVDDTDLGLESTYRTLAAGVTSDHKILQITERSICLTTGSSANFEDCARIQYGDGLTAVAATIDTTRNIAVTAMRSQDLQSPYKLQCYKLITDDLDASGDAQIVEAASISLDSEPLCTTLISLESGSIALVATADAQISAFALDREGPIKPISSTSIPASSDGPGACDSMVILKDKSSALAVCGLRDGRVYTVALDHSKPNLFGEGHALAFSQSTVKVSQPPDSNTVAYAMSGSDTCRLSWDGNPEGALSIQNIWISDRLRPELAQGAVEACTHMPPAHLLTSSDLADSFIMISGDEFLVASLNSSQGTVSRQIPISGTPNRLIYSERQRCLVCASLRYDVRRFPSHSKAEERRQIWPVIDFLPSRSSKSSFTYNLQPGERVFALLEWSFKQTEDKTYSFILVGGSYTKSSGSQRGRILFLQPMIKSWEVIDVKEGRSMNFEAPVYALALYREDVVIACVGQNVVVLKFDAEKRKWEHSCEPLKLASEGIQISVDHASSIHISTMQDGLASLKLTDIPPTEDGYTAALVAEAFSPRADYLLSHVVSTTPDIILASTKFGQLLGFQPPTSSTSKSSTLLFEAPLPRSLTRLRASNIRPRWMPSPPPCVLNADVLGSGADGSITGIALVTPELWRKLSWIQRLCEWSPEISPLGCLNPLYGGEGVSERAMPVGFEGREEVVMRAPGERAGDWCVDGDVLARLLGRGDDAGRVLRGVVGEVAGREDGVGVWMRRNLEGEVEGVEEGLGLVRAVLGCWL